MSNNDKLLIDQVNYLSHEDIDLAKKLLHKVKSQKTKDYIENRIKHLEIIRSWKH